MTSTKKIHKSRQWLFLTLLLLLPLIYCIAVLSFVFSNVWNSGLEGGGNGPADSYRHSLASAVVAHTLSPHVVYLITDIMERSNDPKSANIMDKHNNLLGAKIGSSTPLSFSSIHIINTEIKKRVGNGAINATNPDQIRIMPKYTWVKRRFH